MNEHKRDDRIQPPGSLHTKTQRLFADIRAKKVRYLRISVLVGFDPIQKQYLRTPRGMGITARFKKKPPVRIGQERRRKQRLARLAHEELARAA